MFKKSIILVILLVFSLQYLFGQTVTDKNGNKVYNGSAIAIFTRIHNYEVRADGSFKGIVPDDMTERIRIGMNVMATTAAQNQGIQVVNRDDATFKATQSWIEESKNEEYLEGLSVAAKKIGATHILVQDIAMYIYSIESHDIVYEVSTNAINVQTNISKRCCHRYRIGINGGGISPEEVINEEKNSLREYFMDAFPVFFVINNMKGKYAYLMAASEFGMENTDKIYFYQWKKCSRSVNDKETDFSVMQLISIGEDPQLLSGLLRVKLNNAIEKSDNLVIKLGQVNNSELNTYYHVPVAIVPLKFAGKQYEDYCKREINNALYNALYGYLAFNVIETDDLSLVKNERELQKTEDFIDGAVIEQFKASGVMYLITLTDYVMADKIVSLKLNVLNVEDGSVEKSLIINCPIDSIEEEMKLTIRKIIISPSAIGEVSGKQLIAYSTFPLATESGERFTLLYNKPIKNPVDGVLNYSRIAVASGRLVVWRGQEYVLSIDTVLDNDSFKNIDNTKHSGLYYLQNCGN